MTIDTILARWRAYTGKGYSDDSMGRLPHGEIRSVLAHIELMTIKERAARAQANEVASELDRITTIKDWFAEQLSKVQS